MKQHPVQLKQQSQHGFAMLFTVLIVSLILSIAISISNLTLKQAILSNLAKDSQVAFYQADAAVECGLYEDTTMGNFPKGGDASTFPKTFDCGGHPLVPIVSAFDSVDYASYQFSNPDSSKPCFTITFDKTLDTPYKVQGYGYNICNPESPRQVERALEVKY